MCSHDKPESSAENDTPLGGTASRCLRRLFPPDQRRPTSGRNFCRNIASSTPSTRRQHFTVSPAVFQAVSKHFKGFQSKIFAQGPAAMPPVPEKTSTFLPPDGKNAFLTDLIL
jgi:hypothetical protein